MTEPNKCFAPRYRIEFEEGLCPVADGKEFSAVSRHAAVLARSQIVTWVNGGLQPARRAHRYELHASGHRQVFCNYCIEDPSRAGRESTIARPAHSQEPPIHPPRRPRRPVSRDQDQSSRGTRAVRRMRAGSYQAHANSPYPSASTDCQLPPSRLSPNASSPQAARRNCSPPPTPGCAPPPAERRCSRPPESARTTP